MIEVIHPDQKRANSTVWVDAMKVGIPAGLTISVLIRFAIVKGGDSIMQDVSSLITPIENVLSNPTVEEVVGIGAATVTIIAGKLGLSFLVSRLQARSAERIQKREENIARAVFTIIDDEFVR